MIDSIDLISCTEGLDLRDTTLPISKYHIFYLMISGLIATEF